MKRTKLWWSMLTADERRRIWHTEHDPLITRYYLTQEEYMELIAKADEGVMKHDKKLRDMCPDWGLMGLPI